VKILSVGVEFFHADGRTDMAKVLIDFRNFVNAAEKLYAINFRH